VNNLDKTPLAFAGGVLYNAINVKLPISMKRIARFLDTFAVSHIRVCEPKVVQRFQNPDEACAHAAVVMTASGSAVLAQGMFRTREQIDSDFASVMAYEPV